MLGGHVDSAEKAVDIASALIAAKKAQLTALQSGLAAASPLCGQGLNGAGVYALHVNGVGGNDLFKAELRGGTHSNKLNLVDLQGIVLPLPPWPNKSGSWPRLIS